MRDVDVEDLQPKRGVKTKFFGVILVFVGAMDAMLAWRGGFAVSTLYAGLLGLGIFVYVVGACRAQTIKQGGGT